MYDPYPTEKPWKPADVARCAHPATVPIPDGTKCVRCKGRWQGELVRDALVQHDEQEQGAITRRLTVRHSHAVETLYQGVRLHIQITSPEPITAAEAREKAAAMFPPAFGGAA